MQPSLATHSPYLPINRSNLLHGGNAGAERALGGYLDACITYVGAAGGHLPDVPRCPGSTMLAPTFRLVHPPCYLTSSSKARVSSPEAVCGGSEAWCSYLRRAQLPQTNMPTTHVRCQRHSVVHAFRLLSSYFTRAASYLRLQAVHPSRSTSFKIEPPARGGRCEE
jgi:hypothetical protein